MLFLLPTRSFPDSDKSAFVCIEHQRCIFNKMITQLTDQLLDTAVISRVTPQQPYAVKHGPDKELRVGKVRAFKRFKVDHQRFLVNVDITTLDDC